MIDPRSFFGRAVLGRDRATFHYTTPIALFQDDKSTKKSKLFIPNFVQFSILHF